MRGGLAKHYSIFTDGIQKFSMELNGSMIRTLDEDFSIVNLPWGLSEIPGGSMDHKKLSYQYLKIIAQVTVFNDKSFVDAETSFLNDFSSNYPELIRPIPSPIFRCTSLISVNYSTKVINLIAVFTLKTGYVKSTSYVKHLTGLV